MSTNSRSPVWRLSSSQITPDVVGGKVYVNGGFWSRLQFPSYPAVVPHIAIVAALHVPAPDVPGRTRLYGES